MKNIHIAAPLFRFKKEKQFFENICARKIKNYCKGSIFIFHQPFPVSYIPLCLKNENKINLQKCYTQLSNNDSTKNRYRYFLTFLHQSIPHFEKKKSPLFERNWIILKEG